MRKTIGLCVWAVLLAAALGARAPDAAGAESQQDPKAPGKRLRLQFQETRQRGDVATVSRTSTLLLHADADAAYLFVGRQLAITQNEKETATTNFKNVGVMLKVKVAALPEGRYRLEAEYEDSQKRGLAVERAPGPVTAGNPVLQIVKARSGLTLREGESVPFASAVDPITGEIVQVQLTLAAAAPPKPAAVASGAAARLRAQLVLTRRQGPTTLARRPYAVLLPDGGDGSDKIEVFSGSQLPVQTRANNQVTVMLKDVGAGLKLAVQRLADGRYRLNVEFSDGVLSPGEGAPELHVFQSESVLFVREGETLTLASAVDPQTGEVVEAELTLEGVK
jgi:Flp pilus assembly secretin CpaC